MESRKGDKPVPIIACTANALKGEVEKCLAGGMNDYLAKPVELDELLEKLDQWLPIPKTVPSARPSSGEPDEQSGESAINTAIPVDRSVLAAISGGDETIERDILIDFRRINDEDATMLKNAVIKHDTPQITRASHRIKGASKMVGAIDLAAICELIESASRTDSQTAIDASMGVFSYELGRLNTYLDSL